MKKAVFFCPHPDDELLVGGGLLYAMANNVAWEVYVVYATNGDYYAHEARIRIIEAVKSCKALGIPEEKIIFMGYGNEWKNEDIYCAEGNKELVSIAGLSETYSCAGFQDYAYRKTGKHNKYTRNNYKSDLMSILKDYLPEVIVCVDFDSHPDHRTLNLLLREVIKDLLRESTNYYPLILTKFAYEGVMKGEKDYYHIPHNRTVSNKETINSAPFPGWDDRISLEMPVECDGLRLTKNPLFLASLAHKSQHIRERMISAINADIVYWRIFSDNLVLKSKITTSSGDGSYINDLKVFDVSNIHAINCNFDAGIWFPEKADMQKKVTVLFEKPYDISYIEIYVKNESGNDDVGIVVSIAGNNYEYHKTDFLGLFSIIKIHLEDKTTTEKIDIQILDESGKVGISEICVYDEIMSLENYSLPLCIYKETQINKKGSVTEKIVSLIDYIFYVLLNTVCTFVIAKYTILRRCIKALRRFDLI